MARTNALAKAAPYRRLRVERWLKRHEKLMYYCIWNILKLRREDPSIDDAYQVASMIVANCAEKYEFTYGLQPSTYLMTAVRNGLIQHRDTQMRYGFKYVGTQIDPPLSINKTWQGSHEETTSFEASLAVRDDCGEAYDVKEALSLVDTLEPRLRRVIVASYLEGVSGEALAQELGLTRQRIQQLKIKGLGQLRRLMGECDEEPVEEEACS